MIASNASNDKPKAWLLSSYKVTIEENVLECQAETSRSIDLSINSVYPGSAPGKRRKKRVD
jgi:hypothetical protein